VFTTFSSVSQAQTKAFPKGGNPSSVGKYFLLPGTIGKCTHQSFAAIHSHNTGNGSPNIFDEKNSITQTVIRFPYPWFNFLVLQSFLAASLAIHSKI
jgi:hypothetical protein